MVPSDEPLAGLKISMRDRRMGQPEVTPSLAGALTMSAEEIVMETTGDPQTPAAMTPPTELGDAPERRSTWPTVIGIIAIVYGALGVLAECNGLVFNVFVAIWGGSMQGTAEAQKAQFEVMRQYAVPNLIFMVVGTVLAAWLLVAGIGVLRRRPWSRSAAVGWAVAKTLFTIPYSVLGYLLHNALLDAMEQAAIDSGTPMGDRLEVPVAPTVELEVVYVTATSIFPNMHSGGAAMMGCSMLWAWALPLFLIIWFLRAPVKTEVERWALESRAKV